MQQGILTGEYTNFDTIPHAQAHSKHFQNFRGGTESRHFEEGAEEEIIMLLESLNKISKELNVSISTIALACILLMVIRVLLFCVL